MLISLCSGIFLKCTATNNGNNFLSISALQTHCKFKIPCKSDEQIRSSLYLAVKTNFPPPLALRRASQGLFPTWSLLNNLDNHYRKQQTLLMLDLIRLPLNTSLTVLNRKQNISLRCLRCLWMSAGVPSWEHVIPGTRRS